MPIGNGCFCDLSYGKFNRETIIRLTVRDLLPSLKTERIPAEVAAAKPRNIEPAAVCCRKSGANVDENIMLGL